jgi:hypothetical protein
MTLYLYEYTQLTCCLQRENRRNLLLMQDFGVEML